MTPRDALVELLARLGASDGVGALVSEHALSQWPAPAVAAMKLQRLLAKAPPATTAICPGCERECVMPVRTRTGDSRAAISFIDCDKRDDVSRVPVPIERLRRWRCTASAVCGFVATALGVRHSQQPHLASPSVLEIGIAKGAKRSQMLCLRVDRTLALVVGCKAMPLDSLVDFEQARYVLDAALVSEMVDATTQADTRHTPSSRRRELGKLDTQDMYAGWQTMYRALRKEHPGKSDVWFSQRIAKSDKGCGRNANTIKKHMKY